MVGTKATRAASGHDPVGPEAQAEVAHWRALAAERDAALHTLTRRPIVRIALGLDRRLTPATRWLRARSPRLRACLRHAAVRAAGLRARPGRHARQATLDREIERLGPAPTGLAVSVITLRGSERPSDADGVTPGDVLCFVPEQVTAPDPHWMDRLANAVGDGVVAASPTLVHPERAGGTATEHDLLVRTEGFAVRLDRTGAPVIEARGAGTPVAVGRPPTEVAAAPLRCLAVDRGAYLAAGGLLPDVPDDIAAVDLCIRLRRQGGRIQHVADAVVFDDRPVISRASLRHPIDATSPAWRALVERQGPAIVRAASLHGAAPPTRWVLTTAVPSDRLAPRWGDWHLAEGLARALRRQGEEVRVQTHEHADSLAGRSCDVHLVLHGLRPVARTPGQRHILWVISHPETLDADECDAADLILVASPRFAAELRNRTSTPVEVLLQATDPDRFSPQPVAPAHAHPVTIVAKTRDVLRPMVVDALEAGLRPAIYGSGWDGLVDPALVVADYVANEDLPAVYSSAGVVLNDHWDTMRAWGFVSNRVFDVLACGTPIVSDHLDELAELFGDAVPTYRSSRELGALVARALEHPDEARARAAAGRAVVLAHHTFDHRAQELLALAARHGLRDDPAKDERRT